MYELYYYPGKASLAPHILLEELGVEHELVLVDFAHQAHKDAAYLKLNPSGRIPVLLDGSIVLYESAAICLHLTDQHPEAGLAPSVGTPDRAQFYKWLIYLTNTLQTELLMYFYSSRWANDESGAQVVKQHAQARIGDMLQLLDDALADSPASNESTYLLGANYTAADIYLFMLARWTRLFAQPARSYPHLGPYLSRIAQRPAVERVFAAEGLDAPFV